MASPALKDLPKVAENLKTQLEGFNTDKLKNASTHEKIVLPTAEGNLYKHLYNRKVYYICALTHFYQMWPPRKLNNL